MTAQEKDNWSPNNYEKHASFVPKLGSIILNLLDAQTSEHVLDFGCGDGVLTKELAKQCKAVTGIDASDAMIQRAKEQYKAENINYYTVNGYDLDTWFDSQHLQPFDAVFSSATMHWLNKDPVKAIRNIHHVLKPNGRFVAEFGGYMNCAEVHTALIHALNKRGLDGRAASPWFFPSKEHYTQLLEENGYEVTHAELTPRMTELNTDVAGWIETFGFNFLKLLPSDQDRKEAVQEIQDYLQPGYQREDGKWFFMYNRLRVIAVKK